MTSAAETTAATTAATRTTVQEFLSRVGQGDPERIAELFAEKVDWLIAENPGANWIRPRSTRQDAADHFRELAASVAHDAEGNTVDVLVADGEEAMLTGQLAATVRATGKHFRSPFAMWLTVRDGLIIRCHVYEDSRVVAAACVPGTD